MSCCGNKRAAISRQRAQVTVPVTPAVGATSAHSSEATARSSEASATFKYVGPGKLTLKGASSGTSYVFTRTGAELAVSREDSIAMMSHRYLRLRSQ